MSRARRWFAAVAALTLTLTAGCASSPNMGGETFTPDNAMWVGVYLGALVLAVVGAHALVESNRD